MMTELEKQEAKRLLDLRLRVLCVCTIPQCRKCLIEGPEMSIMKLNESWGAMMATAGQMAAEEASGCACVYGQKTKQTIGLVIVDTKTKKGVEPSTVLGPENMNLTAPKKQTHGMGESK